MSRVYRLTRMRVSEGARSHWPHPAATPAEERLRRSRWPMQCSRCCLSPTCAGGQLSAQRSRQNPRLTDQRAPDTHKGPKPVGPFKRIWARATSQSICGALAQNCTRQSSPHAATPAMSRLAEKWLDIDSSSTAETWSNAVDSFCFLDATRSHFYSCL